MDGDLTTVVVAFDDLPTALSDYADLRRAAAKRGEEGDYEAAVIERGDDGDAVATSTVRERERDTVLGAGLGLVAGALISPALPAVIVGTGIGIVIGNLVDRVDAFKHSDLEEVRSFIDDSAATLIVICDEVKGTEFREIAVSRHRRVVVSVREADIDVLKRELQRVSPPITLH